MKRTTNSNRHATAIRQLRKLERLLSEKEGREIKLENKLQHVESQLKKKKDRNLQRGI